MRLKPEIQLFIRETAANLFPDTDIYLFGSRVNDQLKGGDIDLLLLSENKLNSKKIRQFRIAFFKKFGWQKLDLVNFTKMEESNFKRLILKDAQAL